MLTRKIIVLLITTAGCFQLATGQHFVWPEGKRAAVSLSFDDGRTSQIDQGRNLFEPYDIKATFYVMPRSVMQRFEGWREMAKDGHEIGNHSVHHPCSENFEWVQQGEGLESYSVMQMSEELHTANEQLAELLDAEVVSFAYPCGLTYVGKGKEAESYIPVVARTFASGRRWLSESDNDPWVVDLAQVNGMEMDGKDYTEIKALIDDTLEKGRWLVLAGHEIGYSGRQTTQIAMLEELLEYASRESSPVWFAPVGEVTAYIMEQRKKMEEK